MLEFNDPGKNIEHLEEESLLKKGLIPEVKGFLLAMIGNLQDLPAQDQEDEEKIPATQVILSEAERDEIFKADIAGTYWAFFGDFIYSEAAQEFASNTEYLSNTIRDYFYHNRLFSNSILEDLKSITTLVEQQKEILKQGDTKTSRGNIIALIGILEKFILYLKAERLTPEGTEEAVDRIQKARNYKYYQTEERNRLIRETELYKSFEEFISQRNFPNTQTPNQWAKEKKRVSDFVLKKIVEGKWPSDIKSLLAQYQSGEVKAQGVLYLEFIRYLQSQKKHF